jgi:hypothetical protein
MLQHLACVSKQITLGSLAKGRGSLTPQDRSREHDQPTGPRHGNRAVAHAARTATVPEVVDIVLTSRLRKGR